MGQSSVSLPTTYPQGCSWDRGRHRAGVPGRAGAGGTREMASSWSDQGRLPGGGDRDSPEPHPLQQGTRAMGRDRALGLTEGARMRGPLTSAGSVAHVSFGRRPEDHACRQRGHVKKCPSVLFPRSLFSLTHQVLMEQFCSYF